MDRERSVSNERVDDIPVLLASQQKLGLVDLVNTHFPAHGHWQGVTPGELLVVWLTFILSEGDHRLNQVAEWAEKRLHTLRHYTDETLTVNDVRDDRLAILLRLLSDDAAWTSFEAALNGQTIRVYDLDVARIRVDSTTASGHWHVTDTGLFQYGHSKDHRPDLPQLKVKLATLDPLGLPLVTHVVSGHQADDPLYLPAIDAVRTSLARCGLLYIGAVKMAAATTRATMQAQGDYYLCPLSAVQLPREELLALVQPVMAAEGLTAIVRPQADGPVTPIADAFERCVTQSVELAGETHSWTERQLLVRSHKLAARQARALDQRLQRAQAELATLTDRKQGKRVPQTTAAAQAAADAILAKHDVSGLLHIDIQTQVQQRQVRKYRDRPARTVVTHTITVVATPAAQALADYRQTLGWRCYVTNAPQPTLALDQAILAYRDQYIVERTFGRLKGKPLSLTPMYLERDDHATGLVRLLSIGLRILSLLEFSAQRALQQTQSALAGLYTGNPTRRTASPTAELLLRSFKDLILTVIHDADAVSFYLTPLSALQSQVLALLDLDDALYLSLIDSVSWKPPSHLHEP